jgi:hypothetical protein
MDLLEIILPILFAVGYFIVAALKGGSKEEENETPPPQAELSERERQIQEEIRRKILERTQGGGQSTMAPPPQVRETQEAGQSPRSYDPTKPEGDRSRRQVPVQVKGAEESSRPGPLPTEPFEPPPLQPAMQRQESTIQDRMRKQEQEIQAMQRRAEEIRRKAGAQGAIRPYQRSSQQRSRHHFPSGSFQEEVIASLKDPRGFKKALLSYEILGTPVGMRKQDKMGPLWQQ